MSGWLQVLFEIVEFVVRGAIAYASTPEGAKELNDVIVAWEARANTEDSGGQVGYRVYNTEDEQARDVPNPVAYKGGKPGS